jgi:hypothetical protein
MKQYYIYLDNEQTGPLSFEELKEKNISRETSVWFEGQANWKKAFEIEELTELFKSVPPPINTFTQTPPLPKTDNNILLEEDEAPRIFGIKRNVLLVVVSALFLLIIGFNFYQEYNRQVLDDINQTTEIHNQQIELQQKEIEEQKARLAEQEQIEADRKVREKREALEKRYAELNNELNVLYNQLSEAKKNLNNVTAFKLLRTSSERNEQISLAQNDIDLINEEIRNIEEEMKKINEMLKQK